MKNFTIWNQYIWKIYVILCQYWWPVKDNYWTLIYTDLTQDIISDIRDIFRESINKNSIILDQFQYFTLLRIIDMFLLYMWDDEFSTVTWKKFYEDGISLHNQMRRYFRGLPSELEK